MPLGQIAGGIYALADPAPELPRRNIGREAQGYYDALPRVLRGQGFYGPQLQGVQETLRNQALFGSTAGFSSMPLYKYRRDPNTGELRLVQSDQPIYTPETEGLLSQVERVQPELQRIRESADPEGLSLLAQLTKDAAGLVGRGADPFEDRELTESLRGAQSSRGLAHSPSAAIREVLALDRARDARRMSRGQYGVGVLAARRGYMGDPTTDALRLYGATDLTTANQFTNPFNSYTADVANTNFGAQAYEEIEKRNSRIQGASSIGSGVTSLAMMGAGGGFGGMGGMGGGGGVNSNATDFLRRGQYF